MTPRESKSESKSEQDVVKSQEGDPLLRALRELPLHAPSERQMERHIHAAARAAFVQTFEDVPWYGRIFGTAGKAVVPVALAGVVGLYLFWAFATAISINQ